MKRFTETLKWQDPWFRRLSGQAKLIWGYMTDHCDLTGLVDIDLELVGQDLRMKVSQGHIDELGDRIQRVTDSKYFIPKFIPFQYGELSSSCPPHKKVIQAAQAAGLVRVGLGYRYPNARVGTTLEDRKRIGRGQEEEEEGGCKGEPQTPETPPAVTQDPLEIPATLKTPDFVRAWGIWMNVRRGMKKPGNWVTLFRSQLDWLAKYDPTTATEILSASTRNGWTGLFEPKSNANHASRGPAPGARKNFTSTADNAAARIREIESAGDTWPEDPPPMEPPGMAQEPL